MQEQTQPGPMRGDRGRQNDRPSAPGRRAAQPGTGAALQAHSTAPLDPIYAWGIVLEPVETMIEETSTFIEELAEETFERREPFSDDELEARFLAFFELLVEDGTLNRLPDAPPEMGRRILGPRRWLHAQRIRIDRLVQRRCEHEEGADRSARGT